MYADFWDLFLTHEYSIYTLLISKKSNEYDDAISIINNILLCYKLNNKININFVVGMRNGVMLSERLNNIELIISPMFQKKNEIDLNKLYDASQNINIPSYWSIIKYKFYKPMINDIKLIYEIDDKNIVIDKNDFSYTIVNNEKNKLSFIMFINDDKSDLILKKENINNIDMWIPKDNAINSILDSVMGEYNMINIIEHMELQLLSVLNTDTFKNLNLQLFNIVNLLDDIKIIYNNPTFNYKICSRCEYTNKNIKLFRCRCKKIYYCDIICQTAHRALHKLTCN